MVRRIDAGKIIRKFAKKDARIKPIFIKNNVGYGGAVSRSGNSNG